MLFPKFCVLLFSLAKVDASWTSPEHLPGHFSTKEKFSLSDSDIARLEIINALETGQPKHDEAFHKKLTEVLLKNVSQPMSGSELALWIMSLISRNENPRNQNGINMVSDLTRRVDNDIYPKPFLVLALCNAHAVTSKQLMKLVRSNSNPRFRNSTFLNTRGIELDAMILKTLTCAMGLPNAQTQKLDDFDEIMQEMASRLAQQMPYVENMFTVSLITQAMTAYNLVVDSSLEWGEKEAIDFLRKQSSSIGSSIIKAYYISMALNARRIPFLRFLNHNFEASHQLSLRKDIYVQLSIRNEENPKVDYSLTLKIPGGWNLFELMLEAANFSDRFKFSWSKTKKDEPLIYEVDNTPNDPEKGLYWIICSTTVDRQGGVDATPSSFFPHDGENIILWYRSTLCPVLKDRST